MEYKLDCGCLLWSIRGHPDILFCPKHKATPELYEGLKLCHKLLKRRHILEEATSDEALPNPLLDQIEQALAKAEGK